MLRAPPVPLTALRAAFTDAVTGAVTWFPDAAPSRPDVVPPPAAGRWVPVAGDRSGRPPSRTRWLRAPPVPETALRATFTDAVTGAVTWFPDAAPSRPEVTFPTIDVGVLLSVSA